MLNFSTQSFSTTKSVIGELETVTMEDRIHALSAHMIHLLIALVFISFCPLLYLSYLETFFFDTFFPYIVSPYNGLFVAGLLATIILTSVFGALAIFMNRKKRKMIFTFIGYLLVSISIVLFIALECNATSTIQRKTVQTIQNYLNDPAHKTDSRAIWFFTQYGEDYESIAEYTQSRTASMALPLIIVALWILYALAFLIIQSLITYYFHDEYDAVKP